jgi:putative membrane protein
MLVRTQSALATLLAIGVVGAIHAQEPAAAQSQTGARTATQHEGADPAAFVKKAAQDGLTEVTLGKQAATKAQDPKIKQFAEHMVQDHSKANDELTNVARKKGLQVASSLDAEHQAIVQKMSNKSGADFDAAYAKEMLKDHKKAVALFEGATKSSDSDLAAFAQKTLPTLKEHEQMAEQLPGSMHSASAKDSADRKQ